MNSKWIRSFFVALKRKTIKKQKRQISLCINSLCCFWVETMTFLDKLLKENVKKTWHLHGFAWKLQAELFSRPSHELSVSNQMSPHKKSTTIIAHFSHIQFED